LSSVGDARIGCAYRDKHLAPELKAMQNRKFTASDIRVNVNGKLAWTTFAYHIEADFNGRHINADGAGAMAIEKIKNEWRIVMYSTSGKRSSVRDFGGYRPLRMRLGCGSD